ncbi:MAG: hypothetical protein Q8916_10520 [Bacteroidota bacterium]|nr:hypothetical protein [Bacteroidota bacterium]MDP4230822.1 hypothetical protein [Bacteroidota bacterium]MDP4237339.1 hypothetical protein [Bacteroidota bacterium]
MARLIVKHKVADFSAWKTVFDSMHGVRLVHGWTGHEIYRDPQDPNLVMIVNKVKTIEGAKSYGSSPELHEAMKKAGVTSVPEITLMNDEEVLSY